MMNLRSLNRIKIAALARLGLSWVAFSSVVTVTFLILAPVAVGQSGAQKQASPERAPQLPHWSVTVSKSEPPSITLQAEDAPLERVVVTVAEKLGAPITLSPSLKAQRVTAELIAVPLEVALRSLAPQPFVNYALEGGYEALPKCLGIFLHALNEAPPPITASLKARSEAILIEGDTEDPESLPGKQTQIGDEPVLQISFEQRRLSVRARKQPLTAVLYEIASKLGAPFEMQYESAETVDLEWAGENLAEFWRMLPRHARLYLRADLLNYENRPLRIVLLKPTKD